MRSDLLLRLADALEANANNPTGVKFDLAGWGYFEKGRFNPPEEVLSCGTTACAMGLAVALDLFVHDGLQPFNKMRYGAFIPRTKEDKYGDYEDGLDACEILFDIDWNTAEWLFCDFRYEGQPTKEKEGELAVAKRIRGLVSGELKPTDREDRGRRDQHEYCA